MKYRLFSVVAGLLSLSLSASAQLPKLRVVHIGLIYPLSTNGLDARQYTNMISLHAIAGVSRSETTLCASGVSNIIYDKGNGVILGGFSNHILNKAAGLQAAGFMNTVRNETRGLQAAGFLNLAGSIKGMQTAGFCNIVLDSIKGFQSAGFCNLTTGNVNGLQAAGFLNMANNVKGAQLAGFINIADDANTQVAGFINMARKVKGVQLSGFMNIADSSDYPIGVINLIKNGTRALGTTIDERGTVLASFRSGGRVLYGVVGAGYNFRDRLDLYVVEAGIGAHIHINKYFNVNVEGISQSLSDFNRNGTYFKSAVRILPALRIGKTHEIFAGPTMNHIVTDRNNHNDINDRYVWSHMGLHTFNALYIGAIAGVQFHL